MLAPDLYNVHYQSRLSFEGSWVFSAFWNQARAYLNFQIYACHHLSLWLWKPCGSMQLFNSVNCLNFSSFYSCQAMILCSHPL